MHGCVYWKKKEFIKYVITMESTILRIQMESNREQFDHLWKQPGSADYIWKAYRELTVTYGKQQRAADHIWKATDKTITYEK